MTPGFINTFGAFGYGLSAVLFAGLGLLLLTSWRGRMQGVLLVIAVFVTGAWAALSATFAAWGEPSMTWIWASEILRNLSWLLFLGRLVDLQLEASPLQQRTLRRWLGVVLAVGLVFLVPPEVLTEYLPGLSSSDLATLKFGVQVALAVAGLALIEQIFRNTPWQHRWGVKFLCLSIGSLFAYDFFLYADALLFRRMDINIWLARGAANALAVPLLAVAIARNPQWSFDVFISRKIVFHTTALLAAGVYLPLMSLVGYYIRYYGGAWSSVIQTLFFFGAGLVLVVLLFSGGFRSRVRMFISKHFYRYRYDYREEWLHLISVLSGKALQATLPERTIFALGELVDSPGGAIWLEGEQGAMEYQRCWNLSEDLISKSPAPAELVDALSRLASVIDFDQYNRDPDTYQGLDLPAWMIDTDSLRLLVPLIRADTLMGFVLLAKPRSSQAIDWEITDILKVAATQAASYLALEQAAKALAEAEQFAGFNRLSAFVIHDLKNLIAQLSLIARNGERHRHNPAFVDDAMSTVSNSVDKMTHLLAQLRGAMPGGRCDLVNLHALLTEVVRERSVQQPTPRYGGSNQSPCSVYADRVRLCAVIGHVIQNAQDATRKSGRVEISLNCDEHQATVEIEDDGVGMDENFIRNRLFKPFDTTKGLAGMGIGAYECREFIRSLGGTIGVHSVPGEGTRFSMTIPLAPGGTKTMDTLPAKAG
ncbi:MAG: XrtA/PEP-CTERM system histidine kinase PrsK, partial [Rhizobiaceae bacterium]